MRAGRRGSYPAAALVAGLGEGDGAAQQGVLAAGGVRRAGDLASVQVEVTEEGEPVEHPRQAVGVREVRLVDEAEVQVWGGGVTAVAKLAQLLPGPYPLADA